MLGATQGARRLPGSSYLFSHKREVRELARRLADRSIRVWLDEDQLIPGRSWQPLLEHDFRRYLKDWATRYGFGLKQVRVEIDRWVEEVERNQHDLYELGLAAYAKKNFSEAFRLGIEAGEAIAERLEGVRRRERELVEKAVRGFRLGCDVAYAGYDFQRALDVYRRAKTLLNRDETPDLWLTTLMDAAKAHYQLGIRAILLTDSP